MADANTRENEIFKKSNEEKLNYLISKVDKYDSLFNDIKSLSLNKCNVYMTGLSEEIARLDDITKKNKKIKSNLTKEL